MLPFASENKKVVVVQFPLSLPLSVDLGKDESEIEETLRRKKKMCASVTSESVLPFTCIDRVY